MKKINNFLLIILSFTLINCKRNESVQFSINGKVKGDFNNYIYLKYEGNIDSTLVKNGLFSFNGNIKKPNEALLYPGSPLSKETMGLAEFMLENSQIFISLNYKSKVLKVKEFGGNKIKMLKIDSISGSKSEELKNSFWSKMSTTFYKEKNDSIKTILLFDNLYEFISTNPKFVLSGKYLANLTNRHDYLKSDQIKELYKILDTSYQNERDLRFIKKIIKRRKTLDIGNQPPKIALPNQKNELINHESFKGTFLLLEFWASWCGPCRETNPELLKVYNSFERKNFEILGVSQDKDIKKWKKAIKEDKLKWLQVIDTLNLSGGKYNITTIPFNLLLDRNGKIIAREIKPKRLKKILSERLEKN